MGIFDSVWVTCPGCGKPMEFQSKAMDDEAYLRKFTLENAPAPILHDIINSPRYHETCGTWVALTDPEYPPGDLPRPNPYPQKVKPPADPMTHFQGFKWWPQDRPFTYADLLEPVDP
jgi:hypothetical protein